MSGDCCAEVVEEEKCLATKCARDEELFASEGFKVGGASVRTDAGESRRQLIMVGFDVQLKAREVPGKAALLIRRVRKIVLRRITFRSEVNALLMAPKAFFYNSLRSLSLEVHVRSAVGTFFVALERLGKSSSRCISALKLCVNCAKNFYAFIWIISQFIQVDPQVLDITAISA